MLFFNCTQHALTVDQVEAAKQLGQIAELRELETPLFNKLSAMTADVTISDLIDLSRALHSVLKKMQGQIDGRLYAHLPIGSPAFMFEFARLCGAEELYEVEFVFSHTDRVSVDNGNGTKTTQFVFQKFHRL